MPKTSVKARRVGTHLDAANYDPDIHTLPDNRATRRALASEARRKARQEAREAAREKMRQERAQASKP